jgi:polyhydroxybutyrate depolymerase
LLSWLPTQAAEPRAIASVQNGSIQVGSIQRTFVFYVPSSLPEHAPLLIAFHGSGETGEEFRRRTGAAFDRLAGENGFVVVYPDGYQRHWDDCRKVASYSARAQHIDDVAFVRALIGYFEKALDIDPARVFAVGHSNGGQMSIRLALELPDEIRAVAAISASLPTAENLDCQPTGKPISVLVMNGTADPINPYKGGNVSIFGFGNRGTVLSSEDTARYFVALDGISALPIIERASEGNATSWVERSTWGAPHELEVALDTVHGGGHGIPQSHETSGSVGIAGNAFDGPTEIWRFFAGFAR